MNVSRPIYEIRDRNGCLFFGAKSEMEKIFNVLTTEIKEPTDEELRIINLFCIGGEISLIKLKN